MFDFDELCSTKCLANQSGIRIMHKSAPVFWEGRRGMVTGGRGFLGSRVMGRLERMGATVNCCSRSNGCDLRNLENAIQAFTSYKPEIVINCASNQGGLAYHKLCPADIFYDNLVMGPTRWKPPAAAASQST